MLFYISLLPYLLAVGFVLCAWQFWRRRQHPAQASLFLSISVFLLIWGGLQAVQNWRREQLQDHMNSFDLDRNGFIDNAEITPAAREAIRQVTNDTGMNFGLLLIPLIALFLAVFVGFVFYGLTRLRFPQTTETTKHFISHDSN